MTRRTSTTVRQRQGGRPRAREGVRSIPCTLVLEKVREQIDRTQHLLRQVPPERLTWRPDLPGAPFTVGVLLGHLLDCLSGFCAVLYGAYPQRLGHFLELKRLPVNHPCGPEEARDRIATYLDHIEEGFALLTDEDLGRRVATAFVPEGEAVLTLFLGNLEHLINHKFQLFYYLKLLGVPVATSDLYRLRGEGQSR